MAAVELRSVLLGTRVAARAAMGSGAALLQQQPRPDALAPARRKRAAPLTFAASKKADQPGAMRCGMCGAVFLDPQKLHRHFETLHVGQQRKNTAFKTRGGGGSARQRRLSDKQQKSEDRFFHVRARARAPPGCSACVTHVQACVCVRCHHGTRTGI
jgi:hypothetical protein